MVFKYCYLDLIKKKRVLIITLPQVQNSNVFVTIISLHQLQHEIYGLLKTIANNKPQLPYLKFSNWGIMSM